MVMTGGKLCSSKACSSDQKAAGQTDFFTFRLHTSFLPLLPHQFGQPLHWSARRKRSPLNFLGCDDDHCVGQR